MSKRKIKRHPQYCVGCEHIRQERIAAGGEDHGPREHEPLLLVTVPKLRNKEHGGKAKLCLQCCRLMLREANERTTKEQNNG